MSWQPRTILRFERSVPSSTGVARVVTDQGVGFLKAMGNPEGEHVLACEWVGTHLARLLKLSTFEIALIDVTDRDEIPLGRGGSAKPGPALITRAESGHPWGGAADELKLLSNPLDLTRLVLLDTWSRNADRHAPPNQNRKPNRDNVFFSREGAEPGKLLLKAMDYTHAFSSGRPLNERLTHIDLTKDDQVYGLFPEFVPLLDRTEMAKAVCDLKLVTSEQLWRIVNKVPAAWQVDTAARNALVNFLIHRAEYVTSDLPGRLWPQGNLDLGIEL